MIKKRLKKSWNALKMALSALKLKVVNYLKGLFNA
jgi:hypothetical protein